MVANKLMRPPPALRRCLPPAGRKLAAAFSIALAVSSCAAPEPKTLLKLTDLETYWVLDPSRTEKRFLAPAVRFRVENVSTESLLAVDATVAFYRDGATDPWGSGFFRLTERRKRLAPGARVLVTMSSDARYSLEGSPETAFANKTFDSVHAKYFLRVGSSPWVEFGETPIENVIGSKDARELLARPQSP